MTVPGVIPQGIFVSSGIHYGSVWVNQTQDDDVVLKLVQAGEGILVYLFSFKKSLKHQMLELMNNPIHAWGLAYESNVAADMLAVVDARWWCYLALSRSFANARSLWWTNQGHCYFWQQLMQPAGAHPQNPVPVGRCRSFLFYGRNQPLLYGNSYSWPR